MRANVLRGVVCAAALGFVGAPAVAHAQSVDVAKMLNGIERGCNYDWDAEQRIYDVGPEKPLIASSHAACGAEGSC